MIPLNLMVKIGSFCIALCYLMEYIMDWFFQIRVLGLKPCLFQLLNIILDLKHLIKFEI